MSEITSGRVVKRDILQVDILALVDREALNWVVLDVQARDRRVDHLVSSEELWLFLASVAALAIPPLGAVAINDMTRSTNNLDSSTRDADQGTCPFFVAKGSGAFEGDLYFFSASSICYILVTPTVVPLLRPSKSRVSPAGTAMSLRMMLLR